MINEKQKEVYTSPTTDVLEIHFEGFVCASPGAEINDWADDGNPLFF